MNWENIPDWAQAIMLTLLKALKERDAYTFGHSLRVARNAKLLSAAAGLSKPEQQSVELASLFHDLGKIGVPDSVLLKPARLEPAEAEIMREHPVKSAEILAPLSHLPIFGPMIEAIKHHHERIDGAGYPQGLLGEEIPLASRLILIADTFDAMTTSRPYRAGLPAERAYRELIQFAGSQFDFQLVKIFVRAHPTWTPIEQEGFEEAIVAELSRAA